MLWLVRFADTLSDDANRAAIDLARRLDTKPPEGVEEIAPGLVSVLLRLRPGVDFNRLCGEIRLLIGAPEPARAGASHVVEVIFDGEDLPEVASLTGLAVDEFVERHNRAPLRVLAPGFAPGFVYCGFHADELVVPRRERVRPMVPAGTVLFAAGQTAIAATPIRTGWHVIGRTDVPELRCTGDTADAARCGRRHPLCGAAMSAIIITRAGPLTTLQDSGRFGMLAHGISASGPMDRGAYETAGALLERAGTTAIEVTQEGWHWRPTARSNSASRAAHFGWR